MKHDFIIFTGPMFAGKSSALLMALEKFKHQHKRVMVFKPLIDDRYDDANIVTHSGWKLSANVISSGPDILKCLADQEHNPHVVAVDEAFMIPGIADVLIWLYREGFSIVVSSIDMSAVCKPFKEIEKMLPWATKVKKCSAVCTVCSADAFYTYKKFESDDEIDVGGTEKYEPRCSKCHPLVLQRK